MSDARQESPDTDGEVVDGTLVPEAAPRDGGALLPATTPVATQAAMVAAASFATGAATVAMVKHRRTIKAARKRRKARKQLGDVLMTKSFLIDVHLLGDRR